MDGRKLARMAQPDAFDPRAEALASSRKRSGSAKMENIENHPPLNPMAADGSKSTSQFNNLRTRFEDKDGSSGGQGSKSTGHYGSTVSKMKERFQHSVGGKGEEGVGDSHSSTSSSSYHSLPTKAGEGSDRSPEVKKKKVTEGHPPPLAAALDPKRRTSSVDAISSTGHMHHTPPLSPTHLSSTSRSTHLNSASASSSHGTSNESKRKKAFEAVDTSRSHEASDAFADPTLLEPTSHVQRFNYTRALFARMEEETRRAQEREKVMRRKLSPSRHTSGTPSPLLSPTAASPVQDGRKFPPQKEHNESQRSTLASDAGYALGSEPPPSSIPQQQQPKPSNIDESNPDQVLRSRRPHKTPFRRDDSGDRSGKYYQSVDAFKALEDGLEKAFDSDNKDVDNIENTLGGVHDSVDSSASSPPPFIPHSSKLEHSNRPSHRSRSPASTSGLSSSQPSSHSRSPAPRDSDKSASSSAAPSPASSSPSSGVVRRPRKQPSGEQQPSAEETAKKRLSKEEIEAALERADSYLANLGSPDDTKSEEAKKERQLRRSQNHEQSAAARRRFLYGDESGTTPESPQREISQRQEEHGQLHRNTVHQTSEAESKFIDSSSLLSSSASSSPAIPSSPVKSSAYVQLKSQSSSSDAAAMDLTPDLPPPSYHEATEPPPYHEATSTSSMLISQKVLLSQQQQQPKALISGSQPVPVPRRAAPPPPLPKKPATGNISATGAPPPPAPEPGSVEYIRKLDSNAGNRNAVILDSESADDLILPEEHIARHHDEDLENGNVDTSTTSFGKTADFLIARESGDGKEDTAEVDLSDSEPLEIDYQNLSFIEIPPISSEEEDDSSGDEIEVHKPSRVCFSRSPIRVFATYSTNDYDRRNEDVDPVAASAEYELEKRVEKMDVFPVQLQKGAEGLGLSIIGMGVGADAGLEKLGIFIKTLTPNGAAQKSSLIQVNDQIIEVDGKSLVGVTQAYAASVLRNTSGHVNFLIGREKDPSKSEVARLIQQSLEQDRRREEMKEKEQLRLRQLEDSFLPKDEVLERHAHSHQAEQSSEMGEDTGSDTGGDEKGLEESQEKDLASLQEQEDSFAEQERLQLEQETAAGDTTPQSAPSNGEDGLESSPETSATGKDAVDAAVMLVEGQQGSSSDSISPDMENEKLYVKLKESQYKLAVADAERAKLKARILVLDGSENQKKNLEKKVEELTRKFQDRDKHFDALKKELAQYKDMMVASQSQHIELERKVRELGALEKKYHKAKKLIKDYQQREKDFIQERESLFEQQAEKDQQYNSLVKSLKDRIFTLERDLTEAQKAAGLPQALPTMEEIDMPTATSRSAPLVKATLNGLEEPLSPLNQSAEDALEISTSSEVSYPDASPVSEESISLEKALTSSSAPPPAASDDEVQGLPVTEESSKSEFDSVLNASPLLDSSASRDKGNLATAGSNANRRPPSKKTKAQDSSEDQDSSSVKSEVTENGSIHSSHTDQAESGLDMWNKHDSDSTVRKSELKKRKQFQQAPETKKPHPQPSGSSPSIPSANKNTGSVSKPPVAPKPNKSESLKTPELSRRDDSYSDTSSSVSQTSYDPNRPNLKGGISEIPDIAADDTSNNSDGGVTLVSAKASSSAKGFSLPKFNWKPSSKGRDNETSGGVVLLSNRSLVSKHSASDPGIDSSGITLISKKVLDTGYEDYDAASINSDITSSMMVTEPDVESSGKFTLNISGTPAQQENLAPSKRNQNQFQSGPITEWDTEHVCHWLMALELEKYSSCFSDKNITGSTLLQLDGSKLKSIGVTSSKDRELLKKKIKEMKANVEREKKIQEKERKQKEKEQKKMSKKK